MKLEPLLHAQALRVIGQHLDGLGNNSFEIYKREDDYVVLHSQREFADASFGQREFLNNNIEKTRIPDNFTREIATPVHFAPSEIFELDIQRRSRRNRQIGMPDMRNLTSILRAVGGYLDRKRADDFNILWSLYSVKVAYNENDQIFSVHQNLYDFGVYMYLHRS